MEIGPEQKTKAVVSTKAKILAGASVIIAVAGWLLSSYFVSHETLNMIPICWLVLLVALLCGIKSLKTIKNIKGSLWTRHLAWAGCVLSIFFALWIPFLINDIFAVNEVHCRGNLYVLSRSIKTYCEKHDGEFPDPSKWCDLLLNEPANKSVSILGDEPNKPNAWNISEEKFRCPKVFATEGWTGYAFNKNLTGKRVFEVDPNVVVLFETTAAGWNQNGGPELMCPDRHKRIFGGNGSYVLCPEKDDVRFVLRSEVKNLRWNP